MNRPSRFATPLATARRALVVVALAVLGLAAAGPLAVRAQSEAGPEEVQAPVESAGGLSLSAYAGQLEAMKDALEGGRAPEARAAAAALGGVSVGSGEAAFVADPTLLQAVLQANDVASQRRTAARLRRVIDALPTSAGEVPASGADPHALDRLRPRDDTAKGGDVGRLEMQPPTGLERLADAVVAAYDWLRERVRKVFEWFERFWPKARPAGRAPASGAASTAAIAVVAAASLGLLVLAWLTVRKGRAAPVEALSEEPAVRGRDDDPTSRETSEWEARARELAAAGRFREAVRAFYHAALVALFETGALQHRKGRTNWEYAADLAPQAPFRRPFLDLTRLFDREWYGRAKSDPDAVRASAAAARRVLETARPGGPA